jgi:cysteinylglycine-S-conjugate dipeptidase
LRRDLEALLRIPLVSVPGRVDRSSLDAFEMTSRLFAEAGVAVSRLDLRDTASVVTGVIARAVLNVRVRREQKRPRRTTW